MSVPVANYGFQLDGSRFAGGDYGDQYGDTPYGGSGYEIVPLPIVQDASDDPGNRRRKFVAEIQHRRAGKLIGSRRFSAAAGDGRWRFEFKGLELAVIQQFETFFDARTFRLVPNVDDETVYFDVHWVETEFYPVPRRGGVFDLSFTVEEV